MRNVSNSSEGVLAFLGPPYDFNHWCVAIEHGGPVDDFAMFLSVRVMLPRYCNDPYLLGHFIPPFPLSGSSESMALNEKREALQTVDVGDIFFALRRK